VETSLSQPLDVVQPWRTRAIAAAAIAALELVVLLVLVLALVSKPISRHVEKQAEAKALAPIAPKRAQPRPERPTLTRGETSVLVLNGNGRTGAAGAEAAKVRGLGYVVGGVGNAPNVGYTRSLVMYRKGYRAEAARLAHDARIAIVTPLDGMRASQLMGAHIALVVGARS
jgi:LytR cell envelope-related transcriptional attenuator